MTRPILALALMLLLPGLALAAPTEEDLPGVPLDLVRPIEKPIQTITLKPRFAKAEDKAAEPPPAPPEKKKVQDKELMETTKVALNVILGENMILPIASGHPNRLITPFETPKITTASDALISVDQSVVYVTPSDGGLVTMFVTEKDGNQQNAISLTLVPKAIPPREVRLLLAGNEMAGGLGFSSEKARAWEQDEEYTESLKQTLRELAFGRTPEGYGLRAPLPSDPPLSCRIPGLAVVPGQALDGHNVIAMVARITNESTSPLEVEAGACYAPGVLAAATWPHVLLKPGQSSELYVLYRRGGVPADRIQSRPSLLSGAGGMAK